MEDAIRKLPDYVFSLEDAIRKRPDYVVSLEDAIRKLPDYIVSLEDAIRKRPDYVVSLEDSIRKRPDYVFSLEDAIRKRPDYIVSLEDATRKFPSPMLDFRHGIRKFPGYLVKSEELKTKSCTGRDRKWPLTFNSSLLAFNLKDGIRKFFTLISDFRKSIQKCLDDVYIGGKQVVKVQKMIAGSERCVANNLKLVVFAA